MPSPEGKPRPPIKRDANPLATGMLSVAMTLAPMSFNDIQYIDCDYDEGKPYTTQLIPPTIIFEEICPPLERAQEQRFGTFYYGPREPAMIMENGNIADGFIPVNGVEYGEEDVKLIYAQFEKMKYANIDHIIVSWNRIGDDRDRFMKFLIKDVMKRADNPHKELHIAEIFEEESTEGKIPPGRLDAIMQYQKEEFLDDEHFLKDEDGKPVIYVYAQSADGLLDNPGLAQQWYETGERIGFSPVLEAYPLNKMNPYYEKVRWFNYAAGNIWDIFPPSTNKTKDRFRVTVSYLKLPKGIHQGDFKRLDYDPERFREDLEDGVESGLTVVETAWNEWFEHANTENNEDALEAMHDIIPAQPAPPPRAVSGYQYIEHAMSEHNRIIRIEIPPALPPAQPKENPLFAMEVRKRKEEELDKPILKPNFKPKAKTT